MGGGGGKRQNFFAQVEFRAWVVEVGDSFYRGGIRGVGVTGFGLQVFRVFLGVVSKIFGFEILGFNSQALKSNRVWVQGSRVGQIQGFGVCTGLGLLP